MKKYTFLFLYCAYLFGMMTVVGCGDKCSGCPEDVELSDALEMKIPYNEGQETSFANASGDTITLKCVKREYQQEERFATERPESECCPGYQIENLICKLSDNGESFINVRTDNVGFYIIRILANLDGIDYLSEGLGLPVDSIQLNGKSFFNVSIFNDTHGTGHAAFLSINDSKGIVGFILNGEEWALVE